MSRSAFAARFTELVGEPAMQYVTRWRMQVALDWLLHDDVPVAELAARLGYESEAAFSRAFKRTVGVSPGAARRSPPDTLHFSAPRPERAGSRPSLGAGSLGQTRAGADRRRPRTVDAHRLAVARPRRHRDAEHPEVLGGAGTGTGCRTGSPRTRPGAGRRHARRRRRRRKATSRRGPSRRTRSRRPSGGGRRRARCLPAARRKWAALPAAVPASSRTSEPSGAMASGWSVIRAIVVLSVPLRPGAGGRLTAVGAPAPEMGEPMRPRVFVAAACATGCRSLPRAVTTTTAATRRPPRRVRQPRRPPVQPEGAAPRRAEALAPPKAARRRPLAAARRRRRPEEGGRQHAAGRGRLPQPRGRPDLAARDPRGVRVGHQVRQRGARRHQRPPDRDRDVQPRRDAGVVGELRQPVRRERTSTSPCRASTWRPTPRCRSSSRPASPRSRFAAFTPGVNKAQGDAFVTLASQPRSSSPPT